MITIIDYGVGNLFSLKSSLEAIGQPVTISNQPETIRQGQRIILPGVGAFGDAAQKLRRSGLDQVLLEEADKGKPLLGICLGMQLLFDTSSEYGLHTGLGLIRGQVQPISSVIPPDLKVPHMGWNALHFPTDQEKHPLFNYTNDGDCVYFVHSYYAAPWGPALIAFSEYGAALTAAVARRNICGCQFHPEKSGLVGLNILRAFCEMGEDL
ncbi:imidazole glycerol phosphate synthase subunit HisH [Aminipila butyrica]|uniref:Imidazole glycerol phosphate synthase subunit HisH n=1 Tax=Aminipila butyrica TaxID=433296 RepID=A0A858BWT4_9FIRM|nr:imidazole glycerol phosphate synthase subunit HisH [Aminipila butyrica]QIB70027.1 imidazole glycerol phosphate synthase subunit HisH [Aminipila butyrica]